MNDEFDFNIDPIKEYEVIGHYILDESDDDFYLDPDDIDVELIKHLVITTDEYGNSLYDVDFGDFTMEVKCGKNSSELKKMMEFLCKRIDVKGDIY